MGISSDTNVTVTDLLPTGYTFVSATPTTGVYDDTTGIWTIGNFSNSSSAVLTIQAIVNATGNYTNSACIDGDNSDPIAPNNCSSVTPTVTIPPSFSITDASATEGNSLSFTVTLSNPNLTNTVILFSTANDTVGLNPATSGSDYTPLNSFSVTIPAGSTTATVNVLSSVDTTVEQNETFVLNVTVTSSNTSNITDTAIGTIIDNDSAIVNVTATNNGAEPNTDGLFTVSLNNPVSTPTTVTFTVTGTATSGADYTAIPLTVVIPANTTSVTIQLM